MGMRGKRLLLAGGTNCIREIREYARDNGIVLIAAGNIGYTALKQYADEQYDVDTSDVEAMAKLVKDARIDGIFAGGNETNIAAAIRVTEKCGLPYYCDMEQWNALMNKESFKSLCREYGIPVTGEYPVHTLEDLDDSEPEICYPVVVKPVDSCSSNGVFYCSSREELVPAAEKAASFSGVRRILVEEYAAGDEVCATYTICNGKITLSCLKVKYPVAEQEGLRNLPAVYIYPSGYLDRYLEEVNDKVICMLKSLQLRFGTLFIQSIFTGEGIRVFEAGFRPEGTSDFRYTDMENRVNHLHLLIEQALTGEVQDDPNSRDNPRFRHVCCTFTLCARGGVAASVRGLEQLKDERIRMVDQFHHEGDVIPYGQTLDQRMLRFYIRTDSAEEAARVIDKIQDTVTVCDGNGRSILFPGYDTSGLRG